ncbi:MAG: hypothetical protein BMS9Abin07_0535 [Acidimicrobiia bacterium]|nr:MAG: hypothetical protein BMS9Abin07_0535 [Acidimicrobiia bacterium]
MADESIPLTIGRAAPRRVPDEEAGELEAPGDVSAPLGRGVALTLRHLIAVLDREDRLESGTGEWLAEFSSDEARRALKEGLLRALQMAADPTNFRILETLSASGSIATGVLGQGIGLGELSLGQRVGDLVSAGLATKQPETNQVAATAAGNVVVDLVHQAVTAGAKALEGDLP